jgi:hypothetical protein
MLKKIIGTKGLKEILQESNKIPSDYENDKMIFLDS